MKLLIVAPEQIPVPPPYGGSVENCIYQIARQIKGNHEVTIVSLHRKSLPRTTKIGHTTIIRVDGGSRSTYLRNAMQRVKANRYDLIQVDNRPSFIHTVKKAFPTTPISLFMHSMTFVSRPMTTTRKAASDLKGASLIIGNSQSLKRTLSSKFPEHKHKIKFVHLGVDLNKFHPSHSKGHKPFHVLYAGRLIPRKGVPVLMKAIKIARKSDPSIRLSIAGGTGNPTYKGYLRRTARGLGIPVSFKGNLSRSRMPAFYRSGNCFVCPSQKHEAFGLVNVEAMASGLPVIASRNGGIPEIVQHGHNGFLIGAYAKPGAFASQIIRLAKDPGLTRRLAKQARIDAVHRFGWGQTADKLIQIYEEQLRR
ncbi:glycosyltransferase family 4 protein [Paenibacillus sp. PR3]|uniref:Glycosyltransferase family 4 protein n=1 Tax=Paenibacillus terricola TaxID=2763503 RepID=A0ABR8MSY6_9BACL|nr:glycosyltransferase family 4 protein [Paenibacillus terricola]MBD3919038.1 glycosyltransferase family 4 protein [Paenibacillus terricola]